MFGLVVDVSFVAGSHKSTPGGLHGLFFMEAFWFFDLFRFAEF